MTETLGDYPIAPIDGIEPVFARQMLLQAMATVYAKATGRSIEDMMSDAVATWDTEWDSDPEPRTIEYAIEAAQSDLQHWDD